MDFDHNTGQVLNFEIRRSRLIPYPKISTVLKLKKNRRFKLKTSKFLRLIYNVIPYKVSTTALIVKTAGK